MESIMKTTENIDEEVLLRNLPQQEQVENNSALIIKSRKKTCIILELNATPDIFRSTETFRKAVISLIIRAVQAGQIHTSISDVEFKLAFSTQLTADEISIVSSLMTLQEESKHKLDSHQRMNDVNGPSMVCVYEQMIDGGRRIQPSNCLHSKRNDVLELFIEDELTERKIQACNCLNSVCHQNVADDEDSNTPEVLILVMNALGYSYEEILCRKQLFSYINMLKKTFALSSNFNITGSVLQGFEAGLYLQPFGSDMDFVSINGTIQVITNKEFLQFQQIFLNTNINDIQAQYRVDGIQALLRVEEDPKFPGYVKLLHVFPSEKQYFSSYEYRRTNQATWYKNIETMPDWEGTNGPAHTLKWNFSDMPFGIKFDFVPCLECTAWPDVVLKWSKRSRPNEWPSKDIIEKIKQEGCNLAPVGHFDSESKNLQWRLSFCGEKFLLSELKPVQYFCYVALRLILKGDIRRINGDILSSFHIKNVIFWCAERSSCAWEVGNFENCLKACIKALTKFVSSGKFPSYFIVGRNLFNSKMTSELSSKILNLLQTYSKNIYEIMSLDLLSFLKLSTQYKRPALELAVQKSVIHSFIETFTLTLNQNFFIFPSHICRASSGMKMLEYLQRVKQINHTLQSEKQHYLRCHILRSYIHSMLGFMNYACYKVFGENEYLPAARKHVVKSTKFANIALMCRAATFFFMESDFEKCLKICTDFFNYPVKTPTVYQYSREFAFKVCQASYDLIDESDITLLEVRKKQLMSMFFCTGGPSCCDFAYSKTILENLAYNFFKDKYFDVMYTRDETQALPEVIQFELNSLLLTTLSSIGFFLSPFLNCSLLAFLCHHENKNYESRDEVLNSIDEYFIKCQNPKDCREIHPDINLHHEPIHQIANIAAYCHLKAKHYRKASTFILKSMTHFPSMRNAAYGYVKCVVQSFNSD